ncbi:MAG: amidohydrolase family protein, partial [Acidobacteria bacterium]|nr:amidohydrolase family protein [Acidobacteriota bacterium]
MGCLLTVLLGLPVCSGEDINGRWEGTLTFRDAVWRIRMEFARDGGALSATLDLPDMVMAWEPLTVVGEEPVVRVQLPFGVGEFELLPANGGIRSTQTFGDDETMTLELARAGKAPYQREEIFIESAGARLAGTLLLPRGKDRWPGIVLLHGSGVGDRTRWEYRSWADFYARRGIATLIYDRRGQGESTGNLNGDQHFEMLATDGVIGARFVAVHATHLSPEEAKALGEVRAFVCVCRTTERDLGDGLVDIATLVRAGVRLCTGVDSHAISDPFEEARAIELDDRSRAQARHVAAEAPALLEAATSEGYAAIGMAGSCSRDRVVLDATDPALVGINTKFVDDAVVFGANPRAVR